MKRKEFLNYLNELLAIDQFHDYGPNGLQVEGNDEIKKIITGVSANQALFDAAVSQNADTVLTHHGCLWDKDDVRIIHVRKKRFETLLKNNLNLIAYHLPLDAHSVYGNNAQIAKLFQINVERQVELPGCSAAVWIGKFSTPISGEAFVSKIESAYQRKPLHISADQEIQSIAWCSGGAGDYTEKVSMLGVDAYLTGEVPEFAVHFARESKMHLFGAGHHATEKGGIQAFSKHLSEKFNLDCQFIDIDNPV